jgi:ribosome biogenesis protein MAK21
MKHFPTLWAYVNESAASSTERFQDEDESGSEDNDNGKKEEEEGDKSEEEGEEGEEEEKENEKSSKDATQGKQYDMLKRDPQHSGMEESCFWELSLLSRHFHPSTAIMARTLLAGTHIVYNGDPLKDLNAVAFLGKFVRKKPKATSSKFSKKALDGKEGDANTTEVGSSDFVELDEQVVNPEDLFFHKYYSQKVKAVARKGASDDDEIDPKEIDSQDSQDLDSEPDYDKLGDAMFAAGGENSEDSGEVSDSDDLDSVNGDEKEGMVEEDGDEQDSEEDSGEIASLLEMEDTEFEKEEQRSNEGPMEDDGPFASAELYEDQINTLISSSVNVEDFLANDKKRKGGAQDKKKEKKKIKKKKLTPVK